MKEILSYRPLAAEHLAPMARLWAEPEVIRYTAVERPCTREQSRLRLEALLDGQRGLPAPTVYLVLCGGEPCGVVGCPPLGRERRRFGLFYQFLPAFWGRGIGETAAAWLVERMRERYPRAELHADAVKENAASLQILRKLGFEQTGVKAGAFVRDGRKLDVLSFLLAARGEEGSYPCVDS